MGWRGGACEGASGGRDGANVSVGTTLQPEAGALPGKGAVIKIAMVATQVPQKIELPSNQCGNFSRRFLHVVRSSLNGTADVLSAAQADYAAAMAAAPEALHHTHKAAWSELWRSGVEIGGRHEAAVAVNSSLYLVLSSLRADLPFSCAPTGIFSNGWGGRAFWDCVRDGAFSIWSRLPSR